MSAQYFGFNALCPWPGLVASHIWPWPWPWCASPWPCHFRPWLYHRKTTRCSTNDFVLCVTVIMKSIFRRLSKWISFLRTSAVVGGTLTVSRWLCWPWLLKIVQCSDERWPRSLHAKHKRRIKHWSAASGQLGCIDVTTMTSQLATGH